MSKAAKAYDFIVIYPEGLTNTNGKQYWNTQASSSQQLDIDFVNAILDKLSVRYPNNAKIIFATGFSNGGGMAHVHAAQMSETVTAIALAAGAYYDFNDYQPSDPVAVLAFHGTKDMIVPYEGRRELPDIHDWIGFWVKTTQCVLFRFHRTVNI